MTVKRIEKPSVTHLFREFTKGTWRYLEMDRQYSHNKTSLYCILAQKKQHKEIVWKTSFILFLIYLCSLVFMTGCGGCGGINDNQVPEFLSDDADIFDSEISEKLVARIYFDATLSMQGFVVPGSTRYTQMCRHLESVIVSGWQNGTVDFFRFGELVEDIDRNTYLNVTHRDFYQNRNINLVTSIQKVLDSEDRLVSNQIEESSNPDEPIEIPITPEVVNNSKGGIPLVIIVTDLFQDRQDINLLVKRLKEQYIQKDLEIGFLGIRSEFAGKVYDIDGGSLSYGEPPDDPKIRPCYLLVLGRHADIKHYFDLLLEEILPERLPPEPHAIIFSRYLVKPLLSFDGAEITKENLNQRQNPRMKQYEIRRRSIPAKISATLKNYELLPYVMDFESDTIMSSSINAWYAPRGETQSSPIAVECLQVTSKHSRDEDSNDLRVDFILASESLPRRAVYLYEVTLKPNVDTFQVPDWCSEWDMGKKRDGAKTLNLANFVQGILTATARTHEPKIATFHFYIKQR